MTLGVWSGKLVTAVSLGVIKCNRSPRADADGRRDCRGADSRDFLTKVQVFSFFLNRPRNRSRLADFRTFSAISRRGRRTLPALAALQFSRSRALIISKSYELFAKEKNGKILIFKF